MAREIMHANSEQEVDHKTHNTLDNRKENLRLCNRLENSQNKRKYKNSKISIYKGLAYQKGH